MIILCTPLVLGMIILGTPASVTTASMVAAQKWDSIFVGLLVSIRSLALVLALFFIHLWMWKFGAYKLYFSSRSIEFSLRRSYSEDY